MNLQIEFDTLTVIINVFIRLITAVVFIAYLFPLLFREAGVKNGLRVLRYELLLTGLVIFYINTSGLIIIFLRAVGVNPDYIKLATEVITFVNTFGFLIYALLKLKIYTQKYSPESKKMHEKIEKLERDLASKKQRERKK